jgi:hypothetical protein
MYQSERGVNLEQGEAISLFASAARTASAGTNGAAVIIQGERCIYTWILDVTAAAVAANDTLDVYVDSLFGAATWINVAHFTQVLGNGGVKQFYTVTVPSGMATTDATTDCAAGVARGVIGSQFRGRYVIVNGTAASFTFSLTGYAL